MPFLTGLEAAFSGGHYVPPMRLPILLLVAALALSACGGQSASSLAKKACHSLDLNTGVAVPPGEDEPPGLDKMKSQATEAAKKDNRFQALASAMAAWTETTQRQEPLYKNGFSKMTASEKAELDALEKVREAQYTTVAAECRKARAGK